MAAATAASSPSRAVLGSAFGELAASRPHRGSRSLALRDVRGNGAGKIVMTSTVPPKTESAKKFHGPTVIIKENQVTHSITPERLEIVKSMDQWAADNLIPLLKPVESSWQPTDYVPHSESESFLDDVIELRKRAAEIPDEYFVCLVGDMITEEALPTYQTMLNTMDGVRDETGASATPWAIWTRMWTAEENRHGDVLNRYLYLTGRVDMRKVEKTIQYLIGSGMNPKTENNPYLGFLYTSFQERATFISHGNTARHAKQYGEDNLAVLCGIIAADERRHEIAYSRIIEKLFELDPTGAMLGFADMMKKQIVMPAHLMYDGENPDLFNQFSAVAQRIGVYTAKDYVDIMEHLIKRWNVEKIEGLTDEGRAAQEYLCKLPPRLHKLAERAEAKAKKSEVKKANISWIFNREVALI